MDIGEVLKGYDETSPHIESFCWCVGAGSYIDLSQFTDDEILYSEEFDTYCVKYFCGKDIDCLVCTQFKKLCPSYSKISRLV